MKRVNNINPELVLKAIKIVENSQETYSPNFDGKIGFWDKVWLE